MFIVHLAGHLGKDPEVRYTPEKNQKVTSFNVAVNQRKGKETVTIWVRVTVWGDRFDNMISFLKKGSGVIVTGRMREPSKYEKDGKTLFTLEVVAEMIDFSPFGKGDRSTNATPDTQLAYSNSSRGAGYETSSQHSDEDHFQMHSASSYNASTFGQGNQRMDDDSIPF